MHDFGKKDQWNFRCVSFSGMQDSISGSREIRVTEIWSADTVLGEWVLTASSQLISQCRSCQLYLNLVTEAKKKPLKQQKTEEPDWPLSWLPQDNNLFPSTDCITLTRENTASGDYWTQIHHVWIVVHLPQIKAKMCQQVQLTQK